MNYKSCFSISRILRRLVSCFNLSDDFNRMGSTNFFPFPQRDKKFFVEEKKSELIKPNKLISLGIKPIENSKDLKIGSKIRNLKIIKEKTNFFVPKTLVLETGVFDQLLKYNKISDPLKYDWTKFNIPRKIQEIILQKIKEEFDDKSLVIRSSATCEDSPFLSFAGQYSSFLNIKGNEKIIKAIKYCYQSLFSENAKVYAKINGVDLLNESMAIAIQELIRVRKSGVIFTANPIDHNKEVMVVEYTDGLGDLVVSGHIEPMFKVIKKKEIDNLRDEFLKEISKIGLELEKKFGRPQDIEWGYNNGFYVFQSRDITTLNKRPKLMKHKLTKTKILGTGICACRGISSGILKIIKKPENYVKIKKGDVVYVNCQMDASLILKIPLVSALIINGGVLSHFAVIARELNIPCLTNPTIVTNNIAFNENKEIIVDAFSGKILITQEG